MTRISKQSERRNTSPRRPRAPSVKTGSKADNLPKGYKEHANAVDGDATKTTFIPKIR